MMGTMSKGHTDWKRSSYVATTFGFWLLRAKKVRVVKVKRCYTKGECEDEDDGLQD